MTENRKLLRSQSVGVVEMITPARKLRIYCIYCEDVVVGDVKIFGESTNLQDLVVNLMNPRLNDKCQW